ncbi:PAS domain S-box protein [Thermodesulfobacteriota bacterium]
MSKKLTNEGPEQRLRKLEKDKRWSLIQSIQAAVVIHSSDTKIVQCNQIAQNLFGLTENQMMGKEAIDPVWNFLCEDGSIMPLEEYPVNQVLKNKKTLKNYITGIRKPDKLDPTWVLVSAVPEIDDKSSISQVIVTFIDITELKRTEETLKSEIDKLKALLNGLASTGIGVDIVNTDYVVLHQNQTLIDRFGNIVGKKCFKEYMHLDEPCSFCPINKALETKKMERVELRGVDGNFYEILATPLTNPDGTVDRMIEVVLDITERKKFELDLLEANEKYSSLFHQSLQGIYLHDLDGSIIDVNEMACMQTGFSKEELIKLNVFDLHPVTDDSNSFQKDEILHLWSQWDTFKRHSVEGEHQKKDGAVIPVQISTGPITLNNKKLLLAVVQDITEIKKDEKERRELQAQLSNAIEIAHLGPWEYDVATDTFTFNDYFYKIFRTTAEEVGGYKMKPEEYAERFLYPDDIPRVREETLKALETEDPNYKTRTEHRIIYSDGTIGHVSVQIFIVKDDRGKTIKTYGVNQDITDRIRAEEELRESDKFSFNLLENSQNTIIVFNPDTSVRYVNPSFEKITGYTPEEVIGVKAPYPWWVDDPVFETIKERIELGREGIHLAERRYLKKNGDYFWVELSITPVFTNRELKYSFSTWIDITDRRHMEDQLQQALKMESIGTLAGGIAHDFNNILSPILLHSEMIIDDLQPDDPLQHDIKEIHKAGKRARDLVQQILAFARKRLKEKIVLKTSHIVKETMKFLRATIPTTIDIQYDNKAEHDAVLADPTQLNQIVMNLCTNAAHAMREKGGLLEIILENEDVLGSKAKEFIKLNPGQYLKLSVKDNETGIAPDIKDRIFEPYFTTKGVGEGTGFGLATVHSIVQSYGGDIIVESEVGTGSNFYVYLPLERAESQDLKEGSIEIPMGNEHILFVDDEEAIVNIMQKSLERLGYKVTGRTSSVEALKAFRNNPEKFDLVITDMTMPNMTGEDLAKELMIIKSETPLILCTGFSNKIDEERTKEIGIRAFVMKPIIVSEIAKTIRDVLDHGWGS